MQSVRKIIEINEALCDGCGRCVPDCAEGSLKIVDGKAKLVADKLCDGLGACLGACPTGALQIIARVADEFDEAAVAQYLTAQKPQASPAPLERGCPSTHIQNLVPITPCQSANKPTRSEPCQAGGSQLSHWPIQIRLIPPQAPFLQGADVLIVADCCAAAAADFQQRYLSGKIVMMGCPKFDDAQAYIDRFTEIINTCSLNSITLLIMEVPCCSAMKTILKKALDQARTNVPVEQITVSTRGGEIERLSW